MSQSILTKQTKQDDDLALEIDQVLNETTKKEKEKTSENKIKKGKESDKQGKENSPMAQLLEENLIKPPREGEKIKGKVIEIDANAVYVDLKGLGTGIVYGREIKDGLGDKRKKLEPGDEVTATILDLENEDGYVELSVKEALREEAWKDLKRKMKEREIITTKILDANKGGLMVEINGIVGFMPVSQLTAEHYPRVEDGDKAKIYEILKTYINTEMQVCVIDAIPEEEKLIVSEKEAYKDKEKQVISELKVGDVIEGEVSGVVDFGAFVKFFPPSKKGLEDDKDKLEGLVHISQLDWKLIDNPRDIVKVGDVVKAKIIAIDETRISLSIRDLKVDPWQEASKKYKIGDIVEGVVNKINHFGAFVYLDQDIHGLAHVSEFLSRFPGENMEDVIKIGETYYWEIMSLEPAEHRMGLKYVSKVKQNGDKPKGSAGQEKKEVEKKEPKKEKRPVADGPKTEVASKKEDNESVAKKKSVKKDATAAKKSK